MQAAARLVCICALFILANCSDDRVALTLLQPGDTVLAFGDSLTAGFGAAAQQSYPEVLEDLALLRLLEAWMQSPVLSAVLLEFSTALS